MGFLAAAGAHLWVEPQPHGRGHGLRFRTAP